MKEESLVFALLLVGALLCDGASIAESIRPRSFLQQKDLHRRSSHAFVRGKRSRSIKNNNEDALLSMRGGAQKGGTQKKTKAKTKKKTKTKSNDNRKKISEALQEKDAAQALGDAIRERADQWRKSPFLDNIDTSVSSVGFAMGAADQSSRLFLSQGADATIIDGEPGVAAAGVEAATTAVVAHYFLKSHGGAHAIQSICSLLAALSGLGAIFLPRSYTPVLLRRCMIFAMTKHLAGILAACVLTARAVPEIGLGEARRRMEDLVQDPVAQYVFYAACVLFWLPAQWVNNNKSSGAVPSEVPLLWWQPHSIVPIVFTGPVLLREIISTLFVISDVLLLWVYSTQASDRPVALLGIIRAGQSIMNALMSLVVTPAKWRSADALQRQEILARLVSRASLAMEVLVGFFLVADALVQVGNLGLGKNRPSMVSAFKAVVCARLYVNFLWTRRRKIHRLANQMRGGAADLPLYVLNAMLDPRAAMGLDEKIEKKECGNTKKTGRNKANSSDASSATWRSYLKLAMGFDED